MNKTNKFNININKDDQNINDFLYCWSEMGSKPSKNIIYKNFSHDEFFSIISKKLEILSIQKDIIPFDSTDMINVRTFGKLGDDIWISFTTFDAISDEPFIGEICFYYNYNQLDQVEKFIFNLDEIEVNDESQEVERENNLYSLFIGQSGFELDSIKIKDEILENFDFYYNDDTLKQIDKLSKKIKKTHKGISIIYGERGTGKTNVLNYLSKKVIDKNFIFIPTTLFDVTINNPEFRNFIKKNKNSVIVLDDCELYFSDLYSKSNLFTNNLIQLTDGIDSNDLSLNLLLILNCEKESEIDSHLFDSNHILDIINIGTLDKEKAIELSKHLGKKSKIKKSTKVIDIIKNKLSFGSDVELGF
jgi:hypothetical protein